MDLKILQDIPPWEWPRGIGHEFLTVLRNPQAAAADRLLAADLAGDLVVMNDCLAHALLAIVGNAAEPEKLRAKAAISLGPVLEQADMDEFDDPDAVPISEKTFRKIQQSLRKVYLDPSRPETGAAAHSGGRGPLPGRVAGRRRSVPPMRATTRNGS